MYGTDSHAASSFTSTSRGEGRDRRVRKRDSSRKTERGLGGKTTEMKKNKKTHTQQGQKAGPQSIKGC